MLLKLQRRVKELEQDKQSLWQQLEEEEEAQQEKAKVWTETNLFPKSKMEKYLTDRRQLWIGD